MSNGLRKILLVAGASGAALLSACGGGGGSAEVSGSGTLGVYLTDAPACGFDNVYVTVDKVRAHKSGNAGEGESGWIDIPVELQNPKVDLLELTNGVLAKLGDVTLPAGTYNQLRLLLKPNSGAQPTANSVVPTGGTEQALFTPSAVQSGLKLNGSFDVVVGSKTELTLDFDACKSIVTRGNGSYGLKPVITMVKMSTGGQSSSGAINGVIDSALLPSKPVITAQVDGAVVKSTIPTSTGEFSLSPLEVGTYTVVLTTDAHASDVIEGVPVKASGTTAISSGTNPLTMQVSAFNAVSGKVVPVEAQALVAARQTFASGTAVTIKYQNVDVVTGDYSMNLPIAAPRYGQYGTGALPIALSAEPGVAGKYDLQATATGFQIGNASVDNHAAPVVQDFTLAP